jgi:cytochrome P450 family 109
MTVKYSPFDVHQTKNPHETLKELRSKCPVSQFMDGFYYLSKHSDITRAFTEYSTFSSSGGPAQRETQIPKDERTINWYDPPEHTKLRQLLNYSLNAKSYLQSEPFIRKTTQELLDKFAGRKQVNLKEELSRPLPGIIISYIIGIPLEHVDKFVGWTDAMTAEAARRGVSPTEIYITGDKIEEARLQREYVQEQIDVRRNSSNPPDDLITRMIRYRDEEGNSLSNAAILAQLRFLLFAGHETTRNLISLLLYRLIENPKLYERVRNDRRLVAAAIEETLRIDGPVQLLLRTVVKDVEVSGVNLPKGSRVILGLRSGNRDEDAYENADEFNIDRKTSPMHLTLGRGAHYCIGAPLAKLEATVCINELLDRYPKISFAPGYKREKEDNYSINELKSLDVVFPE